MKSGPHMIWGGGSRGEINSKGIYKALIPSLIIGGRVVSWETTWSGVWFLQLRIPCCGL